MQMVRTLSLFYTFQCVFLILGIIQVLIWTYCKGEFHQFNTSKSVYRSSGVRLYSCIKPFEAAEGAVQYLIYCLK